MEITRRDALIGALLRVLHMARISGGVETTYRMGQMFYEQPGSTHEINRNPSATKPARFLAMIFAKKGEPLTAPA